MYDLSKFARFHPGGAGPIVRVAGQDATKEFHSLHGAHVLTKYDPRFCIGTVEGKKAPVDRSKIVPKKANPMWYFGDQIPYGDPAWYQGWASPYYNDSHVRLRAYMRAFVEKEVSPYAGEWDESTSINAVRSYLFIFFSFSYLLLSLCFRFILPPSCYHLHTHAITPIFRLLLPPLPFFNSVTEYQIPKELYVKAAKAQWLAAMVSPPWLPDAPYDPPCGIKRDEWDAFHCAIIQEELARAGSAGVVWGFVGGLSIGLPPIVHTGSDYLKKKVVNDCLNGEKFICLAITEPWGGSDVANLKTTAKLSDDGKHYIVNGEKKWITNGVFADYFTTAVRTGDEGPFGVSLLLIERTMPGVETKQMKWYVHYILSLLKCAVLLSSCLYPIPPPSLHVTNYMLYSSPIVFVAVAIISYSQYCIINLRLLCYSMILYAILLWRCSQGVWASGTTYVTFTDVKVPVENLIGDENLGFKAIMYNFNPERIGSIIGGIAFARVCVEEAFKWAAVRKTFGKRLIDHPVIRMKLAEMVRQVEASHAFLEQILYQAQTMDFETGMRLLAGPVALCKVQASKTFEYCAREAVQVCSG